MADGIAEPSWAPIESEQFKTADKRAIPVMGFRSSTTAVAGTMAPDVPSGGGSAQDNLIDDSIDGTATLLGPFKENCIYEFVLADATTPATVLPDNVHVRFGTSAGLTSSPAIVTDMMKFTSVLPVFQHHFKPGQTHMSIIRATGGAKTMRIWAARLV